MRVVAKLVTTIIIMAIITAITMAQVKSVKKEKMTKKTRSITIKKDKRIMMRMGMRTMNSRL